MHRPTNRGADAPRSRPSSASEPRALRDARVTADLLLKDLRADDPARHGPAVARFARWGGLRPPATLTDRTSVRLKHALRVIAFERGMSDWPELLTALRAESDESIRSNAPETDGARVESAAADGSAAPLYLCYWRDFNGESSAGLALVRQSSGAAAEAMLLERLRETPAAASRTENWSESRVEMGHFRILDREDVGALTTWWWPSPSIPAEMAAADERGSRSTRGTLYAVCALRRGEWSGRDWTTVRTMRDAAMQAGLSKYSVQRRPDASLRLEVFRADSPSGAAQAFHAEPGQQPASWDIVSVTPVENRIGVMAFLAAD